MSVPQDPLLTACETLGAADGSERILIVAPHMDDEAIGAAGFAADALAGGATVSVVFLTAGDCNRFCARLLFRRLNPSPDQYIAVGRTRIAESAIAGTILGLKQENSFILGYPDRGLEEMVARPGEIVRSTSTERREIPYEQALSPGASHTLGNLLDDLAAVLDVTRPTTIFSPAGFDVHPDHSAAAAIVDIALRRARMAPRRLAYLVHQSRFMKTFVWQRHAAVVPPERMRRFSWATYHLSERAIQVKHDVLQSYDSQRPYLTLLRNAFVRPNELFLVHGEARLPAEIEERRSLELAIT